MHVDHGRLSDGRRGGELAQRRPDILAEERMFVGTEHHGEYI
jgi:hypothetical protein